MTDEYIYTMRINRIKKNERKKVNRYDQNLSYFYVDKECFFAWILFVLKSSLNKEGNKIK